MSKYLYLILLVMFSFSSCKIKYKTAQPIYVLDSLQWAYGDETLSSELEKEEYKIEFIEEEEEEEEEEITLGKEIIEETKPKKIKKPKKIQIINNIDSLNLEKGNGVITYQIPEKLIYGQTYIFKLRISSKYKIDINNLLIDKKNIPIATNPEIGPIVLEDIKTSEYMSANLWGDPVGFDIFPLNTLKQKINGESFTEWSWKVKPIKSGNFYIKLSINIDDIDHSVYEKNMLVHIFLKDKIYLFIMYNYEWLWSTIFIPFLLPWIKRKFFNKQNKN